MIKTTFTDPWTDINNYPDSMRQYIHKQLAIELHPDHELYGKPLKVIARREGRDDVLMADLSSDEVYLVHLTYATSQQTGAFPISKRLNDVQTFLNQANDDWSL
ncbi:hypothetical protein ACFODZ_16595 [Marinicella sediminis]|uniref:Uncharacterized protein n=1 Tax=Marinicella sediminis TaxID=1792834 RepID=A0ABV7JCM4_9GAMM|nr:hypothetical protein [Marinicella sediminis]